MLNTLINILTINTMLSRLYTFTSIHKKNAKFLMQETSTIQLVKTSLYIYIILLFSSFLSPTSLTLCFRDNKDPSMCARRDPSSKMKWPPYHKFMSNGRRPVTKRPFTFIIDSRGSKCENDR